jgi:predicted transcriptional regulator
MGEIEFTLQQVLDELHITGSRIASISNIRSNTIYEMVNNTTKSVNMKTLAKLIDTLNEVSRDRGINKRIEISDILRYIDK